MALWIDIRPDSWPRGILRHMTLTILRHSHSWQDELYQDFVLHCCQPVIATVPARCQECLLIWGSSGGSVYEATSRLCCSGETKVCHPKKAIYGLKKSLRVWFEKLNLIIFCIGFRRCHSDHSVFVLRIRSGIVVQAVYVDDILLTGSDSAGIVELRLSQASFCDQGHGTSKMLYRN